jgi:exo-beta-1,3-glucanase (GH17 family)/cellulose synthase/poly-beta-1,6-N-acetylglucosamine synthase-like glycosyltransferase
MTRTNIIITVAIAAVTLSLWALFNRPELEPAWPERIDGFSFSPMRMGQSPITGKLPSDAQIDADLRLVSKRANAVRTYTVQGTLGDVPALARKYNLKVTLGVDIGTDRARNEAELQRAVKIAVGSSNVNRIIVGNEVLLRGDIPLAELTAYIDRVRKAIKIPVSTAEPLHIWLKHPELARHVDFITVHILPYWENQPLNQAVQFVVNQMDQLQRAFPRKRILIGEVGWPSNGRTRGEAVASEANEATFLRRFLQRAQKERYNYFIMEAFDQPWKQTIERGVGAYWGVYDAERHPKFAFTAPILVIPEWHVLAMVSTLMAGLVATLLLFASKTLRKRGRSFLVILTYSLATAVVWVIYDYTNRYLTVGSFLVGILLIIGMVGVVAVLLIEAHEWAEALWVTEHRRSVQPVPVDDDVLPLISVHVPCYNEPPDMVIETLDALARLDYPRFEVLIIDNNTKDPAVWQPVEAHCKALGARFRFFHVAPLAGFKAGALNFTLRETDPEAEIVAVIDSDYVVNPRWLRDLAPQFTNPRMAIVQAPQDYRDGAENAFKAMCYSEYRGFFYIGMVTRNERNAIIQHGTMTMVRRSALEEVGGWGEWTITEDADLGLRIFEQGYEATYIPRSYGRGLMPDTFIDFKKQRFRWAYGAVQIMRRHLGELSGLKPSRLTWGQRYHFVAGWLPWLADGFNLIFNAAALLWSAAMIIAPTRIDPPLVAFALLPLALFVFKLAKLIYLYRSRVDAGAAQTLAAALAGLALSHTIALAMMQGFVTSSKPFFRTPKMAHAQRLRSALLGARDEGLLMLGMWLAAAGVLLVQGTGTFDLLLWVIVLLMQSLPYAASVALSVISGSPHLPASWIGEPEAQNAP